MKKFLLTILFTLVLSESAFANSYVHQTLLNNKLVVLWEGEEWSMQFMQNNKLSSTFRGETNYNISWKKMNEDGLYEIKFKGVSGSQYFNINFDNQTMEVTGTDKTKYTAKIISPESNLQISNKKDQIMFTIKDKREQCEAIGFKPETEKFADCVLRLVELDVKKQQSNKIAEAQQSGNDALVKQLQRQQYDRGTDALLNLSQQLLNPGTTNSNIYMPQTQRCTIQGFGTFAKMVCR